MTSLEMELRKIWYMMIANFWVRFLFALGIIMELVNITIAAGSYFFLTKVFEGTTAVMGRYGTDVVSYIIVGVALNSMLRQSLTGMYASLVTSYFGRSLERVSISPTSIYTLLFSNMISGYLNRVVHAVLYLAVGVLVFSISLGSGNAALAVLVLILGLVATVGLGMLLSQVFFYTSTGKGGPNPILMFASTFATTFSGATFPVEVLLGFAPWLFPISTFLPQTHALSAIRMILAGASIFDNAVITDITYLIIFAAVTIPIGSYLTTKGLDRVRREGYAPHPGGIWIF